MRSDKAAKEERRCIGERQHIVGRSTRRTAARADLRRIDLTFVDTVPLHSFTAVHAEWHERQTMHVLAYVRYVRDACALDVNHIHATVTTTTSFIFFPSNRYTRSIHAFARSFACLFARSLA